MYPERGKWAKKVTKEEKNQEKRKSGTNEAYEQKAPVMKYKEQGASK